MWMYGTIPSDSEISSGSGLRLSARWLLTLKGRWLLNFFKGWWSLDFKGMWSLNLKPRWSLTCNGKWSLTTPKGWWSLTFSARWSLPLARSRLSRLFVMVKKLGTSMLKRNYDVLSDIDWFVFHWWWNPRDRLPCNQVQWFRRKFETQIEKCWQGNLRREYYHRKNVAILSEMPKGSKNIIPSCISVFPNFRGVWKNENVARTFMLPSD